MVVKGFDVLYIHLPGGKRRVETLAMTASSSIRVKPLRAAWLRDCLTFLSLEWLLMGRRKKYEHLPSQSLRHPGEIPPPARLKAGWSAVTNICTQANLTSPFLRLECCFLPANPACA
jgi:hypothetical protein